MDKFYDIYVDGVFTESWEDGGDARARALVIEQEFGLGRVRLFECEELFDWEEENK